MHENASINLSESTQSAGMIAYALSRIAFIPTFSYKTRQSLPKMLIS